MAMAWPTRLIQQRLLARPPSHPETLAMKIRLDDLTHPDVHALLSEHLRHMHSLSPAESVFALNLDGLRQPGIEFYTAWDEGQLVGCGAIKRLDDHHGELKSMRTPEALRRRGAGRAILVHLIARARALGLKRLSLETGKVPGFHPAHALYRSEGFAECGPFGPYQEDPHSLFMTLALTPLGRAA